MLIPLTRDQRIASISKSLTLLGIDGQIRLAQRRLVELDEFDAEYGEKGQESRDAGRVRAKDDLARSLAAYEMRKAALSPEKRALEARVVDGHAASRELAAL